MMRSHFPHILRLAAWPLLGALALPLSAQDSAAITQTRDQLREWIEIQKTISEEATSWQAESAVLSDMIHLLKTESTDLAEQIAASEAAVSEADGKRAELTSEREEYIAAVASIEPQLAVFEAGLKRLHKHLPPPLQEEVAPLFRRLPDDPSKTRLTATERLQAVIGILSQADRFNGGVLREAEIRDIDGQQSEVQTLYFGLAAAYFANAQGTYGGIGYPGPDGWTWDLSSEHAPAISRLIAVYMGTREAEFVPVPVKVN